MKSIYKLDDIATCYPAWRIAEKLNLFNEVNSLRIASDYAMYCLLTLKEEFCDVLGEIEFHLDELIKEGANFSREGAKEFCLKTLRKYKVIF